MANTKISDIGSTIGESPGPEEYRPAYGDGTAKPGDFVGIVGATNKVVQADLGASELFVGILDFCVDIADDTAITDGKPCNIIIPKSGRIYNVHIEDPAGTEYRGQPYGFSNTAGAAEAQAALNTAGNIAVLEKQVDNGDTVGKIRWL